MEMQNEEAQKLLGERGLEADGEGDGLPAYEEVCSSGKEKDGGDMV
jgi:hypothetical protein